VDHWLVLLAHVSGAAFPLVFTIYLLLFNLYVLFSSSPFSSVFLALVCLQTFFLITKLFCVLLIHAVTLQLHCHDLNQQDNGLAY
jgi:hypothetical protein